MTYYNIILCYMSSTTLLHWTNTFDSTLIIDSIKKFACIMLCYVTRIT